MSQFNFQMAMAEYHDELDRLKEINLPHDSLWDIWYSEAGWYEPDIGEKLMVDIQKGEVASFDKRPVESIKSKHRKRRRATAIHKLKLKMTADILNRNYYKRSEEDMRFAKRRIAGELVFSKSRTFVVDRITKHAQKIKKPTKKPLVATTAKAV